MHTRIMLGLLVVGALGFSCKKEPSITVEEKKPEALAAAPAPAPPAPAPAPAAPASKTIAMEVTGEGFVPDKVTVKAGEPVTLVITRKTDETCATEILIDGTDIKTELPLNKPVQVAWTPSKAGAVKFGCAMDKMIGGVLLVE